MSVLAHEMGIHTLFCYYSLQNDPGSTPDQSGASHFTTYLKARIYCEREVPTGREFVGALDYQYNDISKHTILAIYIGRHQRRVFSLVSLPR